MAFINKNVSTMAMPSGMNRMGQFPLDMSSVYYDLESLQAYATSGSIAYVGQIVSLVDEANHKVTVYSIQNTDGLLKEVGTVPTGDESSIIVDAEGKISLKGVADLVFERELEDGSKEDIQYQALMTKNGLVWVEPSKTTVEGLATLIEALTVRVKAAEDAIDAIEADYLKAADKEELSDAIAAEAETARAAEKANADAIKAIADDYLKGEDKYDDTALAARVKAIEDDYLVEADKYDDTELAGRVSAIEADYLKAEHIANMATNAEVEAAVKAEADRAKEAEESLQGQINLIMNNPDTENVINSINEFTKYIEDHGEIAEGFRTDIDANAQAVADEAARAEEAEGALSGRLDVLEAIDHEAYIAADTALKSELNGEIAKKADSDDVTALELRVAANEAALAADGTVAQAIAAAEGRAATDAQTKADAAKDAAIADAASKYATTGALSDLESAVDGRLEALEAHDHTTYATKTELNEVSVVANNANTTVNNLSTRFDEIVAVGGEPNAINAIKVNGSVQTIVDKTVDISVPTKFSDIADDSGFDSRITTAQTAAEKGISDAAAAATAASAAQAKADSNATAIGANSAAIDLLKAQDQTHTSDIAALQQHDRDHTALYETLNGTVATHGTDIAGLKTSKADVTVTDGLASRISANEAAIKTLNETTVPAINAEVAKKANAADVYTKDEVNAITGTVVEGKTLVKMIEEAQSAATYDDAAVRELIAANAKAIADEAARADAAEKDNAADIAANGLLISANAEAIAANAKSIGENAEAIATIDATLKAALDNNGEGLDSIKELASWIEKHGKDASTMAEGITANTNAIAAINDGETGILAQATALVNGLANGAVADNTAAIAAINDTNAGILAQAKAYTDAEIAALPAATVEALGLVRYDGTTINKNENNQLYVAKVSTDILEQGSMTLVLNAGSASV